MAGRIDQFGGSRWRCMALLSSFISRWQNLQASEPSQFLENGPTVKALRIVANKASPAESRYHIHRLSVLISCGEGAQETMTIRNLEYLFKPRSIAVIGRRQTSRGPMPPCNSI
jgi:hypothetical protein